MLNSAGTSNICSSSGSLLEQFSSYVDRENIPGDVVHLFHAKDFTGTSTVGCAWVGTLCRGSGYSAGVNELSFTNTPSSMAKLLAHENGHICGGQHTSDTNDIMYGSLCATCGSGFGAASRSSIGNTVAQATCTSTESTGGWPAPVPRPVPVPVPVPVPQPFPVPVPRPVPAPVRPPIGWPVPVPAPRPAPRPTSPTQPNWFFPSTPTTADSCADSITFSFQAGGQSLGCSVIRTFPSAWKNLVCGYGFVESSCRKSCGAC